MSWAYTFAQELKKLGRTGGPSSLVEGEVVRTNPLTVSLYGGEVMAPPLPLRVAAAAPGYTLVDHQLSPYQWQGGERVVCGWLGKAVVILGRLS